GIGDLDIRARDSAAARLRRGGGALLRRAVRGMGRRPPATGRATSEETPPTPQARAPWDALDARATASRGEVHLVSVADAAEPLARVAARTANDSRIRHVHDATWFRWRLCNPLSDYRCLMVGDPPRGYLVLAAAESERTATIADWRAETPALATGLLDAAIAWGRFRRLRTWAVSLDGVWRDLLSTRGFRASEPPASLTSPRRTVMIAATGQDLDWRLGGVPLLDRASWDLRVLYSDGA
ncbi:MAG: hypothetical protein M3442_15895, partial [Chloroflexota bacterium]|nr:hypothetical protein [Chloroflexota bacterium]